MNPHIANKHWLFVYKTVNSFNGKVYIGQHKTSNINDGYIGSGLLLQRAVRKYGTNVFKTEILKFCTSVEEANTVEAEYIKFYRSLHPNGYNIVPHAFGGIPPTASTRTKISTALRGIKRTEAFKLKLRKPKPYRSIKHRTNISASLKGRMWFYNPKTNESRLLSQSGEIPQDWIKGRPTKHTDNMRSTEAIDKLSKSLKGRVFSNTTREKISFSKRGRKLSEETKQKISATLKRKYETSID